jgi:hypothetical protein
MGVASIDSNGFADWQPTVLTTAGELKYVLRAYDKSGNFDETSPQPLWLSYAEPNEGDASPDPESIKQQQEGELLASYGESGLAVSNIRQLRRRRSAAFGPAYGGSRGAR